VRIREVMKTILFVGLLVCLWGCNTSDDYRVTSRKIVIGRESYPTPSSGCVVTVENQTQRITVWGPDTCEHLKVGDKAVLKEHSEKVLWINNYPYSVHSTQAK
jgi:hypothetical protein